MPRELSGGKPNGVYLLGLRGSGKTTLARHLAERLAMEPLDTDQLLAQRHGRTPAEILASEGEPALRRAESELLQGLRAELEAGRKVLALGGGSAEAPGVEPLLAELRAAGWRGVWLVVEPGVLARRLRRGHSQRPRLAGRTVEEEIRVLAARRAALFARLADLRFDNSEGDAIAQADRLAARLVGHGEPPVGRHRRQGPP